MLVVEYDYSFCVAELVEARRFTEEEKSHYAEWFRERGLVAVGERIPLAELNSNDMPIRHSDGSFCSTTNQAWIVDEQERDAFIALNAARIAEKAAAEKAAKIAALEAVITKGDAQGELPTRAEKAEKLRAWNNLHNEGGEGFLPWIVSREEYENAKKELEALNAE